MIPVILDSVMFDLVSVRSMLKLLAASQTSKTLGEEPLVLTWLANVLVLTAELSMNHLNLRLQPSAFQKTTIRPSFTDYPIREELICYVESRNSERNAC